MSFVPDLQRGRLPEVKALSIYLGLRRKIAARLDSYQRYSILKGLKYISEPEPIGNFIIKSIGGLKAPGDKLEGVVFGAFIFAESYFDSYQRGKKSDLDKFIACYYTTDGKFNQKEIEKNALMIEATIPFSTREAIAINYALVREWLSKCYPNIFVKAEAGEKQKGLRGWVQVFDKLVENDLANEDKYAQLPVHTVLRYINNRTKEYYKNGCKV
jgi:hypothetical protein